MAALRVSICGQPSGGYISKASYNAAQDLSRQQCLDVLGREEQGCPGIDEHQAHNDGPSVPELLRHPAVDHETDEFSNVGSLIIAPQVSPSVSVDPESR